VNQKSEVEEAQALGYVLADSCQLRPAPRRSDVSLSAFINGHQWAPPTTAANLMVTGTRDTYNLQFRRLLRFAVVAEDEVPADRCHRQRVEAVVCPALSLSFPSPHVLKPQQSETLRLGSFLLLAFRRSKDQNFLHHYQHDTAGKL